MKRLFLLALLPALASAQVRPPPGVPSSGGTFTGPITATNLSGTNTGDVTITAVGSSPSANGASLSGQALTLQPADNTRPGVVTAGTQTFGGAKTFTEPITTPGVTSTGLTSTRGITSSALLTPVNGTFTATTGTLNNGSYCYRVTARNAAGETLPSTETCLTVSGGAASNGVIVTWGAVVGAADYVVEGRTTGIEQDMAVVTAPTVTWTDNGSVTPSGAMPTEGTSASITTPSRVSALRIDSTAASGAVAFRLLSGSKMCLDSSESQCFWYNGTAIRTDGNFIGNGMNTFWGVVTQAGNLRMTPETLGTCGDSSNPQGTITMIAGATTVPTKMCVCTYVPTGTVYAWQNTSGTFATSAASFGNTTTCPDSTL